MKRAAILLTNNNQYLNLMLKMANLKGVTMKFDKELEGKEIFAIGTGNNARNYKNKIISFTVVKVKIKYVTLKNGGYENNYSKHNGATESEVRAGYGTNAGYIFFKTFKDAEEYNESRKMNQEIRDILSYSNLLSYQDCKKVLEIIKK